MLAVDGLQVVRQPFEGLRIFSGGDVGGRLGDLLPALVFQPLARVGFDPFSQVLDEFLLGQLAAGHPDDGESLGEQTVEKQVVQGRNQFSAGQVAGGAEDHHDAGIGGPGLLQPVECAGVAARSAHLPYL